MYYSQASLILTVNDSFLLWDMYYNVDSENPPKQIDNHGFVINTVIVVNICFLKL